MWESSSPRRLCISRLNLDLGIRSAPKRALGRFPAVLGGADLVPTWPVTRDPRSDTTPNSGGITAAYRIYVPVIASNWKYSPIACTILQWHKALQDSGLV